jgi:hypothetical protein
MTIFIRRSLAVLTACVMLLAAGSNAAADQVNEVQNGSSPVVFDVLILRPLGFATLGIGTGLFVASVPILLITRPQQIGLSAEYLLGKPAKYLWVDDLGGH